jgi:hypothetical protein
LHSRIYLLFSSNVELYSYVLKLTSCRLFLNSVALCAKRNSFCRQNNFLLLHNFTCLHEIFTRSFISIIMYTCIPSGTTSHSYRIKHPELLSIYRNHIYLIIFYPCRTMSQPIRDILKPLAHWLMARGFKRP